MERSFSRGRGTRARSTSRGSSSSITSTKQRKDYEAVDIEEIQDVLPESETTVVLNGYKFKFSTVEKVHHHNLIFTFEIKKGNEIIKKQIIYGGTDYVLLMKKEIINELFNILLATHHNEFLIDAFYVFDRNRFLFSSIRIPDGDYIIPLTQIIKKQLKFFGRVLSIQAEIKYINQVQPNNIDTDTRVPEFFIETSLTQDQFERKSTYLRGNKYLNLNTNEQVYGYTLKSGHSKAVVRIDDDQGLIIIDPKKTLFYKEESLIDFLQRRFSLESDTNLLSSHLRSRLIEELKNLTFETTHREHSVKCYDISTTSAKNTLIEDVNQNVSDYFLSRYSIQLRYPHYPCIVEKRKERLNYYPLEVLKIHKGQRVARSKIVADVESQMIRNCQVLPFNKIRQVEAESGNIPLFHQNLLENAGIMANENLHQEKAKILYSPLVNYNDTAKETKKFSWGMLPNDMFVKGGHIRKLLILLVNVPSDYVSEFIERFIRTCNGYGVRIDNYHVEQCRTQHQEELIEYFKEKKKDKIDYVLAIGDEQNFHNSLKIAELNSIIVTQQILYKTITGFKSNTISNIIAKLNLKAGGINYELGTSAVQMQMINKQTNLHKTMLKDTMVIGIYGSQNVSHGCGIYCIGYAATTTEYGNVTVGGYFYNRTAKPPLPSSRLEDVCEHVIDAYVAVNKKFPKRILMYRGGVALAKDTDYNSELHQFGTGLRKLVEKYESLKAKMPSFTLILGTKQHSLRLFKQKHQICNEDSATAQNVIPGTCVDTISENQNEFIIVSHKTLIGTAKPFYCRVLSQKGTQLSLTIIEQITYNLSYGHEICTSPIAVPSPVRCAEELADRGLRNYIHSNGNSISEPSNSSSTGAMDEFCLDITNRYAVPAKQFNKRYWA